MEPRRISVGLVATSVFAMGAAVPFLQEPACIEYQACQGVVGEIYTGAGHSGGTYVPSAGGWLSTLASTTASETDVLRST